MPEIASRANDATVVRLARSSEASVSLVGLAVLAEADRRRARSSNRSPPSAGCPTRCRMPKSTPAADRVPSTSSVAAAIGTTMRAEPARAAQLPAEDGEHRERAAGRLPGGLGAGSGRRCASSSALMATMRAPGTSASAWRRRAVSRRPFPGSCRLTRARHGRDASPATSRPVDRHAERRAGEVGSLDGLLRPRRLHVGDERRQAIDGQRRRPRSPSPGAPSRSPRRAGRHGARPVSSRSAGSAPASRSPAARLRGRGRRGAAPTASAASSAAASLARRHGDERAGVRRADVGAQGGVDGEVGRIDRAQRRELAAPGRRQEDERGGGDEGQAEEHPARARQGLGEHAA